MPDDPADAAERGSAAAVLAAHIRRLRRVARLSHAEIANRIGYSPMHVSRAERDETRLPSADLVRALDRGLNARGGLAALRERAALGAVVQRARLHRKLATP